MSFFDEVDEPPERQPRTEARGPRSSGRGRPPRGDQQAIQTRRTVAVVAILIVIVLLALGIHSCDVSARNSALRDYADNVYTIINDSNDLGSQLFTDLGGGTPSCTGNTSASQATALYQCVAHLSETASTELAHLKALSVPSQMQTAQTNLELALKMRRDGLNTIAGQTQAAFSANTAAAAVQGIATGTSYLYGSDVVYKGYAAPAIFAALSAAGLHTSPISSGQIVSNLSWLQSTSITEEVGAPVPGAPKLLAPELTPGQLVAVGTNTMVTGVTNHVAASPPPTFTIPVKNPGSATDFDIQCTVTVHSTPAVTGTATISTLAPGAQTTCSVTLLSSPATTSASSPDDVTARVSNTKGGDSTTFPVQFLPSTSG